MCPNEKVCGNNLLGPGRKRICCCVIWRQLICIQSGLESATGRSISGENGYPHLPVLFCQLITRPFSPDWKATFNWLGTIGRCLAVKWDFSSSWNQNISAAIFKRFQRTECVPGPPGGTRGRSPSWNDTKFGADENFQLFLVMQFAASRSNFLTSESPEFRSLVGPMMIIHVYCTFGRPSVLYSNELFTVSCRLAVNIAILPPNFSSRRRRKYSGDFSAARIRQRQFFIFMGRGVGSGWNVWLHRSNSQWFHSN